MELCKSANSTFPAICFAKTLKSGRTRIKDHVELRKLALAVCKNATDESIERCVSMAPQSLKPHQIITLCGEGRDPISQCFKHLHRKYRNRIEFTIQVCRGAASISPSCALKVPKRFDALQICKGATSDASANCATFFQRKGKYGLTVEDVNLLCSQVTNSGPIACISACPKYLSGSQKVQLCNGSLSHQPASCFVEATSDRKVRSKRKKKSIVNLLIDLCRGASSSAPAICMRDVIGKKMEFLDRISLCKNARSTEPSKCFNALKDDVKTLALSLNSAALK